jgi:hypothetical protein
MRPVHLVPAGVVLLALGAIAGAAQLARPASAGSSHAVMSARQVAVTSAARACPPVSDGGAGQVALIAVSPTDASSGPASGQAELIPLPLAGASLRAVSPITRTAPGALSVLTVPAARSASKKIPGVLQGWSVTATGTMAQAIEAEEATGSGLASVRCAVPCSDFWFTGPG